MKVAIPLINTSFVSQKLDWVGGFYYIQNFIKCLDLMVLKNDFSVEVITTENFTLETFFEDSLKDRNWFRLNVLNEEYKNIAYYQTLFSKSNFDIAFIFNSLPGIPFEIPTVGWIPDFQHKLLPEFFSEKELQNRDNIFDFHCTYNSLILLSSKDSFNSFKSFYPHYSFKAKVYNFPSLVSLLPSKSQDSVSKIRKKYSLPDEFIYLPNQFWIHKNHRLVFDAWIHMLKESIIIPLVMTGSPKDYRFPDYYGELMLILEENNLKTAIYNLEFIPREEQILIYQMASFILQPSLFEGWSTSIEDAKALGKAIIASNIPVHREQCIGSNVNFFDPKDSNDLKSIVYECWKDRKAFLKEEEIRSKNYNEKNLKLSLINLEEVFEDASKVSYDAPIFINSIIKENYELTASNFELSKNHLICAQELSNSQLFCAENNFFDYSKFEIIHAKVSFAFNPFSLEYKLKLWTKPITEILWVPMLKSAFEIIIDEVLLTDRFGNIHSLNVIGGNYQNSNKEKNRFTFFSGHGLLSFDSRSMISSNLTIKGKWKAISSWDAYLGINEILSKKDSEIGVLTEKLASKRSFRDFFNHFLKL